MKQCPSCSRTYTDDDAFCYDDGTPLVVSGGAFSSVETPTVVLSSVRQPVASGTLATKWLFLLVGLLIAAIAVIAFLLLNRSQGGENVKVANNGATVTTKDNSLPSQAASVNPTPASTTRPTQADPQKSYSATTRLVFAKGATATKYAGDIEPGDTRSFVLGCRAGQSLMSDIIGGNGCVTLVGSGRYFTRKGDNYVRVRNSCSAPARFSLNISVI